MAIKTSRPRTRTRSPLRLMVIAGALAAAALVARPAPPTAAVISHCAASTYWCVSFVMANDGTGDLHETAHQWWKGTTKYNVASDQTIQCHAQGGFTSGTCTEEFYVGFSPPDRIEIDFSMAPDQDSKACEEIGPGVDCVTSTASYKADFTGTSSNNHFWFELLYPEALYVSKSGSGSGHVVSTPRGIDCGGRCLAYYTSYSGVFLTETPDPGSHFSGWTGPCSDAGLDVCSVTMVADVHVDAAFELDPAPTPLPTSKATPRPTATPGRTALPTETPVSSVVPTSTRTAGPVEGSAAPASPSASTRGQPTAASSSADDVAIGSELPNLESTSGQAAQPTTQPTGAAGTADAAPTMPVVLLVLMVLLVALVVLMLVMNRRRSARTRGHDSAAGGSPGP